MLEWLKFWKKKEEPKKVEKNDVQRAMEILEWKGEKPEIKKRLDALKVGERLHDPSTGTDYECISKMPNGESITRCRSGNWETI